MVDKNCLSYWFPRIANCGVKVPKTIILETNVDFTPLLRGDTSVGVVGFFDSFRAVVERIGTPCFIRTGHTSGKHGWERTCFYTGENDLESHVIRLVEWSANSGTGLPCNVWVAREFLSTLCAFTLPGYEGMPVGIERRYFFRAGAVEHHQPYWVRSSVVAGRPDEADWEKYLAWMNKESSYETSILKHITEHFVAPCFDGECWSVDYVQTKFGWVLTDMALGKDSFRYDPEDEEFSPKGS